MQNRCQHDSVHQGAERGESGVQSGQGEQSEISLQGILAAPSAQGRASDPTAARGSDPITGFHLPWGRVGI